MNFIKRLNRGNFYLSSQTNLIICGMEVGNKCKISAQYLCQLAQKTQEHGVSIPL